ncbi:MAG: acyl-CoA/acyl-ACP dehydrogenase [Chloroflexi bacterium]|nr:acyl-CoA/acyl-ACP dehydrogenase [Chloroflexota bacterium]
MDFSFTEQQEMLRKIARDFLATECPKDSVRKMAKDEKGYAPDVWKKVADLGWTGLAVPEELGGLGGNFLDITVLVEEMGRAAMTGPFFCNLVGTLALLQLGNEQQKKDLLPKIAQGELILTLALNEPGVGCEVSAMRCQAIAKGEEYVIDGTKLFVENAHVANIIICAAKTKDGRGKEGTTLFLTNAKDPNLSLRAIDTLADDKQFEVRFKGVKVPKSSILGEVNNGEVYLKMLLQKAAVAKCAEMLGGAQQVMDMTVDYVKQRVQFDHPIGSLQAIQHHCANMMVDLEGMRYITYLAAWKASENLPFAKEAAVAKAWASEAYRRITDLAHQSHGAVGFCEDHDLPLYSKRSKASEFAFGDAQFQRRFVAKEIGL